MVNNIRMTLRDDPRKLVQAFGLVEQLLTLLGEDPTREGLKDTPRRFVRALEELTSGMGADPRAILKTTFGSKYDEMVLVKDLPFNSLCEHHIMPFWGTCTIGYLPSNGKIVGLSKLPRLLKAYSLRLQVQENLTQQIAEAIDNVLQPLGVGVVIKAEHTCMCFRGIHTHGKMVTSALLGKFRDEPSTRAEFLALAQKD